MIRKKNIFRFLPCLVLLLTSLFVVSFAPSSVAAGATVKVDSAFTQDVDSPPALSVCEDEGLNANEVKQIRDLLKLDRATPLQLARTTFAVKAVSFVMAAIGWFLCLLTLHILFRRLWDDKAATDPLASAIVLTAIIVLTGLILKAVIE